MSIAAPSRVPVAATCVAALAVSGSIHAAGPSPVLLSERTAESGLTSMHSPDERAVPGLRERMISGLAVGDFNNDGYQDLFCLTGGDLPDRLFINNGNGTFTEIAQQAGFDSIGQGRSLVYLDVELDGDLDIVVGNTDGPLEYYRNETVTGNWLRMTFDTSDNALLAPDGFGTRVLATAGGTSYLRYLSSSPSYLATSELAIHFGLGTAPVVDELRVEFSRGQVMVMTDLPVNRHMVIVAPKLGNLDQDGVIGITDFLGLLGLWGPVGTTSGLTADLDADGTVGITDLLILLGAWG